MNQTKLSEVRKICQRSGSVKSVTHSNRGIIIVLQSRYLAEAYILPANEEEQVDIKLNPGTARTLSVSESREMQNDLNEVVALLDEITKLDLSDLFKNE